MASSCSVIITISVGERAITNTSIEISTVSVKKTSKRTMEDNSSSFSQALEEATEVSAGGGVEGLGSFNASTKRSIAQSTAGSWTAIQDLSLSEETESRHFSKETVSFAEGTTQIYATEVTTISINGHTATTTKEIDLGVGLISAPIQPHSAVETKWLKKAWLDLLGIVTPPVTNRVSFPLKVTTPKPLVIHRTHTKPADAGKAYLCMYLDRQQVLAPDSGVLTGFQLLRPTLDTFNYAFSYVDLPNAGRLTAHYNEWTDEGNNSTSFLDRQRVMAPSGQFLVGFCLRRDHKEKGKWTYEYWSRSAPFCGVTHMAYTRPNDWGRGFSMYLDRHRITVPEGCGLRGFQLYRPNLTTIAYQYWYARVSDEE